MVRIHLYEETLDGYRLPLFRTLLVGFNEFKRLLDASIVTRLGKQYIMIEKAN